MPVFGILLFIFIFATPFGEWFVLDFLLNNPIWILFWIPFLVFIFIFCFSDRLQEKVMKIKIKSLINPKNKFGRFVVNVLFIPFWWLIWALLKDYNEWYYIEYDDEFFRFCLLYLFLFAPMFFYTRFLWYEKSRKRIFFGLFDKLKFNLKQFNSEVFNTTSNADELKKYADLRDQGIITEEEFQAKKKMLLDL
ncbi:hypothetical protein EW14_0765 [Prochlorococcus sp. MIT 0604]|nr:hypothetical protein EW14_0765 [Prochlorococcus sp. MIT 0604]